MADTNSNESLCDRLEDIATSISHCKTVLWHGTLEHGDCDEHLLALLSLTVGQLGRIYERLYEIVDQEMARKE